MKFAIVPVLVSLLIAGTSAQGFSCTAIPNIRCDLGGDNTQVCASNGWTYKNRCEFNKANYDNKGLRVLRNGMCSRSEGGQR
ncbi:hypothetical protein V7S43_008358 [Phytophthora oleae]|uniref:Kazal-like domain-containing protein n=1 Tax=Phytophthora oleae TaxID=2107226 RepID=A0ABD3FIJ4_9STRA